METQTRLETRIGRRFTFHDYHRMAEAGILHEDDRVEPIEGVGVEMTPIGGRHASCVAELTWLLSKQGGDELHLGVQNPVRLGEHGEPQPDLAVIRARDYRGSLPGSEDVLLLIELADTSLLRPRNEAATLCPLRDSGGLARRPYRGSRRAPHRAIRRRLPPRPASRARGDAGIRSVTRARPFG